MENLAHTIKVLKNDGKQYTYTLVFGRCENEDDTSYLKRFEDVKLFVAGELHNIDRIKIVQSYFLCAGHCISNCIVQSTTDLFNWVYGGEDGLDIIKKPEPSKYTVYYKTTPDFERTFEQTKEVIFLDEYKEVRTLECRGLESVYTNMQAEIWSPNGEARNLIKSLKLSHTSMSVGDIVFSHSDDNFYACDSYGFKKIEHVIDTRDNCLKCNIKLKDDQETGEQICPECNRIYVI